MAAQTTWKPYESLTQAPTNLKEAIDWVLRVTGKDGKKNDPVAAAKQSPQSSTSNGPHCLCYLAKAIKDLLYDAKDPGFPGPHPDRYWDDILVPEERAIVQPVLQDLGLLSTESTSATSTNSTCAGGTEVIKALIDHLAQGLQKWVGWQDGEECCLKGGSGESTGIGRKCDCNGSVGAGCCNGGKTCHECTECGKDGTAKCYLSAYCKKKGAASGGASTEGQYYWPTLSSDSTKVHLLARIFLGSVCLIWSGLSQLGFLTGGNGGKERWSDSSLHKIEPTGNDVGLGSFMAAMGYDLDRLNGSGGGKGNGEFVQQLLSGQAPDKNKGIQWKEFTGDSAKKGSVAEYYSSIYSAAQGAAKGKTTESICKDYPLLVLHILASGYFRAGSAGAKGVTTPPKAAEKKEETPSSRKPRTIREILYWLSALPYSQGYKELVTRMGDKTDQVTNGSTEKGKIQLYNEKSVGTTLLQKDITHYLMAASGYCPLVLIGIQGTINTSGTDSDTAAQGGGGGGSGSSSSSTTTDKKKCPNHKEDRNKRCNLDEIKKRKEEEAKAKAAQGQQQQQQQQQQNNNELQAGQVCYGGYHLEVKDFGPLHGMYANGLFGFDMGGSPAQCLDQLRTYVYHCFYQLYFLRKQCSTGAIAAVGGGGGSSVVLGWQSCRYGSGVNGNTTTKWICKGDGGAGAQHTQKCGLQDSAKSGEGSALQSFLCDALGSMRCRETIGVDLNSQKQKYPEIEEHMNKIVTPSGEEKGPHKKYPELCPVPMGWSKGSGTTGENHFKDLTQGTHKTASLQPSGTNNKYPAHCTGNTLSHLLQYYCDPDKCPSGTLVILLRLLACITPTVPRTLGDLFGFYYYIVYIGGQSGGGQQGVHQKLKGFENDVRLGMIGIGGGTDVVSALGDWSKDDQCKAGTQNGTLKCLVDCTNGTGSQYLCPLSGQQYGQLSHLMAGTYLSWLVYLIGEFETGVSQPWYCLLHYPFQVMTEQDQQLSLRAQNSQ